MEVTIRAARLSDVESVIPLVMYSADKYWPFMFSKKASQLMHHLYLQNEALFSHDFYTVAEVDSQVVGILVTFDDAIVKRTGKKFIMETLKALGLFTFLVYLPRIIKCSSKVGTFNPDEYYISNVGVRSDFQRQGIAQALMREAEIVATSKGLKKIVLDVEQEKIQAITLYRKINYSINRAMALKFIGITFSFFRMEKVIV